MNMIQKDIINKITELKLPDKRVLIRFLLLFPVIILLITGSCTGRKKKTDNKNLIPEKELVPLLTDIYLADGLLTLPRIYSKYSALDSITTYYEIIQKHGYTKEMLDRTMKYYFIRNPKGLNKIYDQVLGILSKMESRLEKETLSLEARRLNLWKKNDSYYFPGDSDPDSARFDFGLIKSGFYTLSYTATVFPDDHSDEPRACAYLCSPDSIETGKRTYIKTIDYLKDGQPHTYVLVAKTPAGSVSHLSGWFFDSENTAPKTYIHASIANISFTFSSVQR